MAQTIGIDFGTAYATAAVWLSGGRGVQGRPLTLARIPAVARMLHGGGSLCGEEAHTARSAYALSTIDEVKRFLGRTAAEARTASMSHAWRTVSDPNRPREFVIDAWTGHFTPEEVAAEILKTLKTEAERALGESIEAAVLTVPAAATNRQRLSLKAAARQAGFSVRRIVNEPTAIAIAAAHNGQSTIRGTQCWAIVNFGAGMTDVAIVEANPEGVAVRGVAGDTTLGLCLIRDRLIEQLKRRFERRHGRPVDAERPEVRSELLWIGEECLRGLCAQPSFRTDLRSAGRTEDGAPLDLDEVLVRRNLDHAARPAVNLLRRLCEEALRRARLGGRVIRRLIFAGGGAHLRCLQRTVTNTFNRNLDTGSAGGPPHELPARGAALLAASLDGRVDLSLRDILAQGLGITMIGDRFSTLLAAGSPLPARTANNYTTVENNQKQILFEVREGDRPRASQNPLLGKFTLDGIRCAARGIPNVRVTFNIDEDGILNVEAQDVDTKSRQIVRIERSASARIGQH